MTWTLLLQVLILIAWTAFWVNYILVGLGPLIQKRKKRGNDAST